MSHNTPIDSEIRALLAKWPLTQKIRILALIPLFVLPPLAAIAFAGIWIYRNDLAAEERRSAEVSIFLAALNIALSLLALRAVAGALLAILSTWFGWALPFGFETESAPQAITTI